jgi:hypothetical protein
MVCSGRRVEASWDKARHELVWLVKAGGSGSGFAGQEHVTVCCVMAFHGRRGEARRGSAGSGMSKSGRRGITRTRHCMVSCNMVGHGEEGIGRWVTACRVMDRCVRIRRGSASHGRLGEDRWSEDSHVGAGVRKVRAGSAWIALQGSGSKVGERRGKNLGGNVGVWPGRRGSKGQGTFCTWCVESWLSRIGMRVG